MEDDGAPVLEIIILIGFGAFYAGLLWRALGHGRPRPARRPSLLDVIGHTR